MMHIFYAVTLEHRKRIGRKMGWYSTNHADIRILYEGDGVNDEKHVDQFVPDFALYRNAQRPYFLCEVTFSQRFIEGRRKIDKFFALKSVVGAVLIDIEEKGGFKKPASPPVPFLDTVREWKEVTRVWRNDWDQGNYKPLNVQGYRLAGAFVTTFYLYSRKSTSSPGDEFQNSSLVAKVVSSLTFFCYYCQELSHSSV